MIVGNRIEFGDGSITIGSEQLNRSIYFKSVRPSLQVYDTIPEVAEYYEDEIRITLELSDGYILLELFERVRNKLKLVFTFKGVIFDFSNYSENVIGICIQSVRNAINAMHFYWYIKL